MPAIRPTLYVTSIILMMVGAMMLVPLTVDLSTGEAGGKAFLWSAGTTLILSTMLFAASRGPMGKLGVREMAILTSVAWLLVSGFGALPFVFSQVGMSYTDAFFETVSGLTTTGSTVLAGLDAMPRDILLWRGILHWVGGIGIVVMGLAVLPILGIGGMQLFRMESSDRSEKVFPRAQQLALALGGIYLLLTFLCAVGYWLAGMSGFEAIVHAMATLATGGFSTSDASIGHFDSLAVEIVAMVFMLFGSLPFSMYIVLMIRHRLPRIDEQVRLFAVVIAGSIIALTLWRVLQGGDAPGQALRQVSFSVISVITTTGFATADYNEWGSFAHVMFLILTITGSCTGSTAGGLKIFRLYIMLRLLRTTMHRLLRPHAVKPATYGGYRLDAEVPVSVIAFVATYMGTLALLTLLLSLTGLDMVSSLSGSATALSNVGPGLGSVIGPAGNFQGLPDAAKWLLSAGMLLGRLEFYTLLLLFIPAFWRG